MWVRPDTAIPVNGTSALLAYNGSSGTDGYGLYQVGGKLYGAVGAETYGGIDIVPGQWMHIALVIASGKPGCMPTAH